MNNWLKKLNQLLTPSESKQEKTFALSPRVPLVNQVPLPQAIPPSLADVRQALKKSYGWPGGDVSLEPLPGLTPGIYLYFSSMVDRSELNEHILEPFAQSSPVFSPSYAQSAVVTSPCKLVDSFEQAVSAAVRGNTLLFFEGASQALVVRNRGSFGRSVSEPITENSAVGPNDGFVEDRLKNLSLLRNRLHTPHLRVENLTIGSYSHSTLCLLYIHGLTNPRAVAEMRRRLKQIKVDYIADMGAVEQYVNDSPQSLFPLTLLTERPDRVMSMLMGGSMAVMIDGSPTVMVAPVNFWSLFHAPEDIYLNWSIGTFARILRIIGMMITITFPGLYIALTNFHQEMIPTELMISIAAAREQVPFPTFLEILFLELALEFIRESALRVPKQISSTIGIVGAIIIGQAAVEANIVSPILVVIMAVTALSGFSIPYYQLAFSLRLQRFFFILAGSTLGFYGIGLAIAIISIHMVSLKSFGVPYLSPVAPYRQNNPDVIVRKFLFQMEKRPKEFRPQNQKRQPKVIRRWDPYAPKSEGGGSA